MSKHIVKDCVVVVPVYKKVITQDEAKSYLQMLRVFKNRDICLVCPFDLDVSYYLRMATLYENKVAVSYFDIKYFRSVLTYNDLMLSTLFYKRFLSYKYMLIYQLDAYVFKDELDLWISKGYDYVGAPWFLDFSEYDDSHGLWAVGNGGFSLRNVRKMYKITKLRRFVSFEYLRNNTRYGFVGALILYLFACKTSFRYFVNRNALNEDYVWGVCVKQYNSNFTVPSPKEAVAFSFEKSPSFLFNLNNRQMPFGCHAWSIYERDLFWSKSIK